MTFVHNGNLITCTPEEYAKLIELGIVTKSNPDQSISINDDKNWIKRGMSDFVALYGCATPLEITDLSTYAKESYMQPLYDVNPPVKDKPKDDECK